MLPMSRSSLDSGPYEGGAPSQDTPRGAGPEQEQGPPRGPSPTVAGRTVMCAAAALLLTTSGVMLALVIASWGTGITGIPERPLDHLPEGPHTIPAWITAIGLGALTAGKLWARADTMSPAPGPQRGARILGVLALVLAVGWALLLAQPKGPVDPPLLVDAQRLVPIAAVIGGIGILLLPAAPPSRSQSAPRAESPCVSAQFGARLRPGRRTAVIAGTALTAAALTGGAALRSRGWLSTLRRGGLEDPWPPGTSSDTAWGSTMPWDDDESKLEGVFAGARGPLALWWRFRKDDYISGWCLAALEAKDGRVLWRREGVRLCSASKPWRPDSSDGSPPLIATSPDGRFIAVGTQAHQGPGASGDTRFSVIVLDTATGEEVSRVSGEGQTALLALTNTHLALQTAPTPNSSNQVIDVWDIATGRMLWSSREPSWLVGGGVSHFYLMGRDVFTTNDLRTTTTVELVDALSGRRTVMTDEVSPWFVSGDQEQAMVLGSQLVSGDQDPSCAGWLCTHVPASDSSQTSSELLHPETGERIALAPDKPYVLYVTVDGWCVGPLLQKGRAADTSGGAPTVLLPQGAVLDQPTPPTVVATDTEVFLKEESKDG